jgi:HAD superfamily hydrolase (TIGR01662 family)
VNGDEPGNYAVVVPTIGRPSLRRLLAGVAAQRHRPRRVVVVDDRPSGPPAPALEVPDLPGLTVVRSGGRGPAAARNRGWPLAGTGWVVFLDDDVELPARWSAALLADLSRCGPDVGGCQGRIRVPLPADRRPTGAERLTAGLETARWATADMAYRHRVLAALHGFDERFPRAFREDADLALRTRRAGWRLVLGDRTTFHPPRPEDAPSARRPARGAEDIPCAGRPAGRGDGGGTWRRATRGWWPRREDWALLRAEAGNADDALMRHLHGRRWRVDADAPAGRFAAHVATVAAAGGAVAALAARRHRSAAACGAACGALFGQLLAQRLRAGPATAAEVRRTVLTTVPIPFAAVGYRLLGAWRHRHAPGWPPPLRAVLFDRDGTLVHDVPYNGDPARVRPVDGAAAAVAALRDAGIRVGVVSNQSGIGRGLLTAAQVRAVNTRIDDLLGPFDTWQVCPHAPDAGCACRKPAPGLVRRAALALRVPVECCAVIGDIGADVAAARAAGARGVLVPTPVTRASEVAAAVQVARDLAGAVALLLDEGAGRTTAGPEAAGAAKLAAGPATAEPAGVADGGTRWPR